MKRDEILKIFPEATDEQLKAVLDLNGADVEKGKAKITALEAEVKEKQKALDDLSAEFNTLKETNASAEDYKTKFEALQKENEEKAKQAEADRLAKEKSARIADRFNTVVGDKKFSHEAIKADYLRKFTEALDNTENEGKSDSDILHDLTKDDAAAFVGVTAVKLAGAKPNFENETITKEAFKKMSYQERNKLYKENKDLYTELNGG